MTFTPPARWKDFNGELTALLPNRLALEKFPEATRPVFKQYKQLMHSAEHYEVRSVGRGAWGVGREEWACELGIGAAVRARCGEDACVYRK